MNREYHRWFSSQLQRPMEFLWFGHAGHALLVFPTSGGRFFENEDFGLIEALRAPIERGELQVVCVDSLDYESWFCGWAHPSGRAYRHVQYDNYLRHELVPFVQWRTWRNDMMVYGASFGAYHAANFAAKHPDVVGRAILFSGIYDISRYADGYWDDNWYFNNPTSFIPNMDEEAAARLRSVEWVVATGELDHLADANRHFAHILRSKGVGVHQEEWRGEFGHDWPWWRGHLPRFVS